MKDILPLFYSSSSLKEGGIFTFDKAGAAAKSGKDYGSVSLCDLAKSEGLTQLHFVASKFADFMTAQKNLKDVGCQMVFGLKLAVCDKMEDKSEASLKNQSNVIIWMAGDGSTDYEGIINIYSLAAQDGFYYVPRIDWKRLCDLWQRDFLLSLPFYSSFIAKNTLNMGSIVPSLPVAPIILREVGNLMPFDGLINGAISRYTERNPCPAQDVKSIYYKDRKDSRQFQILRCILDHKTFDKPNDGMCSEEFCWEAYKEAVKS
jgi:DNA polymerase III alpha subunit